MPHACRIRLGRGAGKGESVLDNSLHAPIDRIQRTGRNGRELLDEASPERFDGVALGPEIHFLLGAVGAGDRITLVVADGAVGLGFDEGWPFAAPGTLDGLPCDRPNGKYVVAVHCYTRNS